MLSTDIQKKVLGQAAKNSTLHRISATELKPLVDKR